MFIIGILFIMFLFLVHNAMSKPIYNKMHNMWQDDPEGRNIANFTIIVMLVISFIMGYCL